VLLVVCMYLLSLRASLDRREGGCFFYVRWWKEGREGGREGGRERGEGRFHYRMHSADRQIDWWRRGKQSEDFGQLAAFCRVGHRRLHSSLHVMVKEKGYVGRGEETGGWVESMGWREKEGHDDHNPTA